MRPIFLSLLLLLTGTPALATAPCINMNQEDFVSAVLKKSDVAVYATVKDYSSTLESKISEAWTKVKVVNTLHPAGALDDKTITIRGWQANDFPLFTYERGDYLVLYLRKKEGNYALTNDEWKHCVPSVWNAKSDGTAYRNFDTATETNVIWMKIENIEDFILANK